MSNEPKEQRFRLVFWAEDVETGEMITERCQVEGKITPEDFRRADESIAGVPENDMAVLRYAQRLRVVRDVTEAVSLTALKYVQFKVRERLGWLSEEDRKLLARETAA